MKRVGFIVKPEMAEAVVLLRELAAWLRVHGGTPVVAERDAADVDNLERVPEDRLGRECEIAMVLGGDGTMLRASMLVADHDVPVLGINFGRLGFLTPFLAGEAQPALEAALAGKLVIDERSRLQVAFTSVGERPVNRTALNDVVIHQGSMARLIALEAWLDEDLITSYRADGLIIATPTGSTAYNLAAGGPILMPGQEAMTLTPICAHALTNRPLVVPKDAVITVRLGGESQEVVLTIDGQWAMPFRPGDEVRIGNADKALRLFMSDKGYFDILRDKLHWGRTPIE